MDIWRQAQLTQWTVNFQGYGWDPCEQGSYTEEHQENAVKIKHQKIKEEEGGNTSQLVLQGQDYPDTKPNKDITRKVQLNIP